MPLFGKKKYGRSFTRTATDDKSKGKGKAQQPNPQHTDLSERAHFLEGQLLLNKLRSSEQDGLTEEDAAARLEEYGENMLEDKGGVSALKVLVRQMANALTLVLVGAMALAYGVQDWIEGAVITAVIVLNVSVGFFQEYRAEKTMDSLRSLSSPTALVLRNGEAKYIPARHVVPGDICMIKIGDVVPADLRLLSVSNLEADEALLTGEALPVIKIVEPLERKIGPSGEVVQVGVGDRTNMAFASSIISKGRGTGIVIATGMGTQVGAIALAMSNKKKRSDDDDDISKRTRLYEKIMHLLGLRSGTPLQIKLSKLAYVLFLCALLLAVVVFSVARFRVNNEVVIYAIAIAISVIPESLIAVLTITMSAGTSRMARQHVIVRKLNALEALGGVTDICSDKTGTLTQGKMILRKIWLPSQTSPPRDFTVETGAEALNPEGKVTEKVISGDDVQIDAKAFDDGLREFVYCASLCNVATITKNKEGRWTSTGDPTEVALQVFAHKLAMGRTSIASAGSSDSDDSTTEKADIASGKRFHLKSEFPFDSTLKRMSTIYLDRQRPDSPLLLLKGAVERVLDASTLYLADGKTSADHTAPLTDEMRQEAINAMEKLASQGLRVLALATRRLHQPYDLDKITRDEVERDFVFLGLAGIYDPPRPESRAAVQACKAASITVHMLTGDHAATATAIAKEIDIVGPDAPKNAIMTATEFNRLTDKEIDALPELPLVIARCSPETKVRMIEAGARRGKYMAMTGDGVNDSPSLKLAPVGIAMGMDGSDVAKDASDLVLTDDNFDSIRSAVGEGRRIFDNIQRFVLHLLTTNVAEVILLVIGLAFIDDQGRSVFPLSPLAILWINMVTSSPPAFGLGLEKPAANLMHRPPHNTVTGVFTWQVIIDCGFYGLVMGATCLLSFVVVVWGRYGGPLGEDCNKGGLAGCEAVFRGRSTVFATIIFQILLYAWELKALDRSMFSITPGRPFYKDLWANQVLFWSVVLGSASVPIAIYVPGLNTRVFHQTGIGWEWGVVVGMVVIFVFSAEMWKIFVRCKPWYNNIGEARERKKTAKAQARRVQAADEEKAANGNGSA